MFAVKLPGRESRAKEPFFQNMQQIVDEVVGVLLPVLKEKPFALFGHRYDNNQGFINNIVSVMAKKLNYLISLICVLILYSTTYKFFIMEANFHQCDEKIYPVNHYNESFSKLMTYLYQNNDLVSQ